MAAKAQELIERNMKLETDAAVVRSHWQDIKRFIRPDSTDITTRAAPGTKQRQHVYDNTGEDACELLAAALHGTLTNPASRWFYLAPEDPDLAEDLEVQTWLDFVTKKMATIFASTRGGFHSQMNELWLDIASMGTGTLAVMDSPGAFLPIKFSARPVAEVVIGENAEGEVDTWFRTFRYTARQAMQAWGEAAGPKVVQAAAAPSRQDEKFDFIHAVYPRDDRNFRIVGARHKLWASVWINKAEARIVKESGFDESPFITGRWSKKADEVYGRGPGMKALPDVKTLQRMEYVTLRGGEKAIEPPLMVGDDGVLSPVRLRAGGLTTVRSDLLMGSGAPIKPILTGARPEIGEAMIERKAKRIERAFYSHLIQINQDPKMTATQVVELSERALQIMGPMLGRMQAEILGKLIDRVGGIMWRAGMLPEPPRQLRGRDFRAEFVSPISRAQRAGEAVSILRTREAINAIAQTNPEVLDHFNADGEALALADLYGYPPALKQRPDVVAGIRKQRQAMQAEQKQALEAMAMADAAGKAAPALKVIQGGAPQQQAA